MERRACSGALADPTPPSKLVRAAIALLARREFSRAELRARLLRRAGSGAEEGQALAEVERALDTVQQRGLLSEERFVEVFVRSRAGRFGPMRLRHELGRRGVEPERIEAALRSLPGDELANARAVWSRRFEQAPHDGRERARQARFLAARGFSHEVIQRLLRRP